MPTYGTPQAGGVLTSVQPGDAYTLFNAETPADGTASVAFALANGPAPGENSKTFHIDFAAAPTAVVVIQCANQDVEADYVTVYTSTNTQHDAYTDIGTSAFYRAKLVSQSAGGALTVTVQR